MWATDKSAKMMNQLQIDSKENLIQKQARDLKSIEGRVVALCLSTYFFGYVLSEISLFPLPLWYHSFGPDMAQEIYIGPCFGLVPLGAALGVFIAHFTQNLVSRRIYLVLINILSLGASAPLQAGGVLMLFIFRTFQGVVSGIWMKFIPVYINQLVPKQFGSRFGVYPQIAVVFGVLVAYTVGMILTNAFNYQNLPPGPPQDVSVQTWQTEIFWRVMLGLSNLPGVIQLILIFVGYIPESPTSLIKKNRREDAKKVLSIFYQDEYVNQNLEERQKEIHQNTDRRFEKSIKWTCKGYYLGFQLAIFQAMTGIAAYVTQTGHVIAVTLQSPIFSIYTPIVITIAQLVGTFISVPLMQFLQWKSLILIGGFACALWNGLIGMFFWFFKQYQTFHSYGLTLAVVVIIAFMFTFGVTVGSASWPYAGYMMPSGAILIGQILNWLFAGATVIFFSVDVYQTLTPAIMIWVFSGVTFIISILNWILMINIKDLTIVQVQQKLAKD